MRKFTLIEVREFLKSTNIVCLSKKYINNRSALLFQCKKCDYQWKTSFSKIHNQKTGCPKCSGNAKFTMKDVKMFLFFMFFFLYSVLTCTE